MYRKYIDLDEKGKSEGCYAIDLGPLFPTFDIGDTVRYCRADVEATLNLFRDTVHNPYSILPADIKVGDKMMVPLGKLGNFTATVQKVTNNKVLFIFDDYVAKRPMNEDGGNAGGYSQSDLKKWIDSELYNMFPAVLKQRMTGLSIPTLGEICGWADKWDRDHREETALLITKTIVSSAGSAMLLKRNFLRLALPMWSSVAIRTLTTLRTLMEFVRNSGWLDKSRGLVPRLYFMEDRLKCRNLI